MRNSNKRINIRHLVVVIAVLAMALLGACSSDKTKEGTVSYKDYLGDEMYDSPNVAIVMDYIEGEDEPGVIYRDITDLEALLNQKEIPVCVFFYSSNATDRYGVFAGVEEISERLNNRVLVIGIDIMIHRELVDKYNLIAVPDFVLVENGTLKSSFGASEYEYWTMIDVYNWLVLNQI